MLSRLLREILYNLAHLVLSVILFFQSIYQLYWSSKEIKKDGVDLQDIKLILEHKERLQKKLEHLIVVADTNYLSIEDLARVVIWSLVYGVPYVSFYDIQGELKNYEEKLFQEVEKKKKGVPGCIKWSNKPDLNGYSNGFQACTVYVNIYSRNDGRPKIAHLIQRIAKNEINCDRRSEMTAQDLDDALSLEYTSIPDPNLALYLGPSCCTMGMLPWQIRLTEFVQLSINNILTLENYLGALYKYNKCDQRFGT